MSNNENVVIIPKEFKVYSEGLLYCSVCSNYTDIGELTIDLNLQKPSGTVDGWALAREPFRSGTVNPCPCNNEDRAKHGFKHYLFSC